MLQHNAVRETQGEGRDAATLAHRFARTLLLCVIVAGGAAACGDGLTGPDELRDPNVPIRVSAGHEFALLLQSNASTGYAWRLAEPVDSALLALLGQTYEQPTGSQPGAAGTESWRFQALASGHTTIDLEYVRSWETDVPPAQTARFDVIID